MHIDLQLTAAVCLLWLLVRELDPVGVLGV